LDRLELVRQQLAEVEAARDALLKSQEGKVSMPNEFSSEAPK
jgi:hypothetical protein